MSETITATGIVGTEPRHVTTNEGLAITSFRFASSQRRYNRQANAWEYTESNWFTVTAFRRLAANAASSLHKGDRVIVTGRLRLSEWKKDERTGLTVEIEAEALGHDLSWGTSSYLRAARSEDAKADGAGEARGTSDDFAPSGTGGWYADGGEPAEAAPVSTDRSVEEGALVEA